MQKEGCVSSMLCSLGTSNSEDKYTREFYEAHQMRVLKYFQVSGICLLIEGQTNM